MVAETPTTPIDLRALPPPEPLLRILELLESAPEASRHAFLLSREPFFLYPMLRRSGWSHGLREVEGGFELTVIRNLAKA